MKNGTREERFWEHAERGSEDDCWEWQGYRTSKGYGRMQVNYISLGAHRLSWEIHNGPVPDGLLVCHRCDNPPCVNPEHLFVGTCVDNAQDMLAKGRATTGASNGAHTQPHRRPRGDRNGARTHPEKWRRGEAVNGAKLTESSVREIRRLAGTASTYRLADKFGVSPATVQRTIARKTWRHV